MSLTRRVRHFFPSFLVLVGGLSFVSIVWPYLAPTDPLASDSAIGQRGEVLRSEPGQPVLLEEVQLQSPVLQQPPIPQTGNTERRPSSEGIEGLRAIFGYGPQPLTQQQLAQLSRRLKEADAQRHFLVHDTPLSVGHTVPAGYTVNDMMISQDEGLTEEEKQVRRDSMEEMLLAEHPDIFNWQERYAAFLVEKQYIIEAFISDQEKADQINLLYYEHFSEEERLQIARLDLLDY
jgi:hypothetical protein